MTFLQRLSRLSYLKEVLDILRDWEDKETKGQPASVARRESCKKAKRQVLVRSPCERPR